MLHTSLHEVHPALHHIASGVTETAHKQLQVPQPWFDLSDIMRLGFINAFSAFLEGMLHDKFPRTEDGAWTAAKTCFTAFVETEGVKDKYNGIWLQVNGPDDMSDDTETMWENTSEAFRVLWISFAVTAVTFLNQVQEDRELFEYAFHHLTPEQRQKAIDILDHQPK